MTTACLIELQQRLDQIEGHNDSLARQVRGWRRLTGGLVALVLLAAIAGAATRNADVIEVRELNLVAANGKTTAKLFNTPEGKPVLSFWNGDSNVLNIGVASDALADMTFYDRGGKPRMLFLVDDDLASMGLFDPNRLSGVTMSSAADGTAGLGILFKDRKDRIQILTKPDGTGHVKVLDAEGRELFHAP
jgi:hypothetical protein